MNATEMFIYVMTNGFVLIGCPQKTDHVVFVTLTHCATVRRWENGKGLGGVASDGPVKVTLDNEPPYTEINISYVTRKIPCSLTKWEKWISQNP